MLPRLEGESNDAWLTRRIEMGRRSFLTNLRLDPANKHWTNIRDFAPNVDPRSFLHRTSLSNNLKNPKEGTNATPYTVGNPAFLAALRGAANSLPKDNVMHGYVDSRTIKTARDQINTVDTVLAPFIKAQREAQRLNREVQSGRRQPRSSGAAIPAITSTSLLGYTKPKL